MPTTYHLPLVHAAEKLSPVTAEARVLKSKVKIGDELRLLLTVEYPRKFTVSLPDPKLNIAPFEIKSVDPVTDIKGQNRVRQTIRLLLTVFKTGDLEIPSIPVQYRNAEGEPGQALTQPVPVKVLSVGKKLTDKDDIRTIKPPVSLGVVGFWSWVYGLAAGGLFIFLVVHIVLRKLREREGLESRKPPHVRVNVELARLKDHGYLEEKDYKSFYSELSNILRRYLERRFGVDALELTTVELAAQLSSRPFDSRVREEIIEVLREADLVKFAKFAPSYELAGRLEGLLLDAVEQTKPSPEEKKK